MSPVASGQDSGPEVVHSVPEEESPVKAPLVVVADEVSGTVTMYRVAGRPRGPPGARRGRSRAPRGPADRSAPGGGYPYRWRGA
jgi:hypothetical protein